MNYTLDTNMVAAILSGEPPVVRRLERLVADGHEVSLNAIRYFETRRGLKPEALRKRRLFEALLQEVRVLELDRNALDIAADLYADLRRKGTPLEDADILVAGIALAQGAVLVTRNLRHFERIDGLRLESWEA